MASHRVAFRVIQGLAAFQGFQAPQASLGHQERVGSRAYRDLVAYLDLAELQVHQAFLAPLGSQGLQAFQAFLVLVVP